MSSLIVIGRVLSPHGLKGEVKVLPLTSTVERFKTISMVMLKSEKWTKELSVSGHRASGRLVILKFTEINTREDAGTLKGAELMVPEGESPELPDGTYYYHQIIGLDVYTTEGARIGRVSDIIETGSNDVYVIERTEDTGQRAGIRNQEPEILIPAIDDVIKMIDLKNNWIIILPLEEIF